MATTNNFKLNLIDFDQIPWHDDEHNNWHSVDALLARYVAISNVQGVWANALAVTVGQRYVDSADDTIWEVLIAHTTPSTGTFAASRTAVSTNWQSISVDASFKGAWEAGVDYTVNDFISDSNRYGVITVAHTSVTSYDTGVSAGNIVTLIDGSNIITSATATTVGAGGSATASYVGATGVLTLGIPTGATGVTGAAGADYTADAELNAIAGLTSAANKSILFTGSGTASLVDITAAALTVLDDANVAAMLATLGGIGAATTNTLTNKTFDANGTGNSLANVDIADLASGTDGELITWDSSGDPAAVSVGTATHVLTSNGAGAAPTFQAGGGAWTLIGTSVASSSASLTITGLSSTYDTYFFSGEALLPATNEGVPWIRLGDSGGIDSGSSDYDFACHDEGFSGASAGGSHGAPVYAADDAESRMELTGESNEPGNAATEGCNFYGYLQSANGTTLPSIHGHVTWQAHSGTTLRAGRFAGSRRSSIDVTQVQFIFSSGNTATGRFSVWGISHA